MTHFIDTNIFLRYFVASDPRKAQACFQLFQQAKQGSISLTTSESVIAEVVFVLSSKCHILDSLPVTCWERPGN